MIGRTPSARIIEATNLIPPVAGLGLRLSLPIESGGRGLVGLRFREPDEGDITLANLPPRPARRREPPLELVEWDRTRARDSQDVHQPPVSPLACHAPTTVSVSAMVAT